ncbi:hypothetical protein COY52_06225 [Candidatus Desantisbacteria bacterium CG_4_10_14_0_8_um_filter_48_22]|uniref:DUF4258 domain-containing protein n=1 Tax=Candidatus Desantisbacteria bacterium CG_4_10_14_0_8_um_filter_48_22 TaxID=1974543 RepID=A0A2M7SB35_9BACT|nr:MAG: hypothetical protein COY52_06225 [Candidatus Desantisbacteria bacterium CG_4_10_14_0_8_um_filter_48_22]
MKKCSRLKLSSHAKSEMLNEEYGFIREEEIKEAILNGEIIEEYPEDRPYSSCLILGFTEKKRPLHIACAPVPGEDLLIVITIYQPSPSLWIDYRRRK